MPASRPGCADPNNHSLCCSFCQNFSWNFSNWFSCTVHSNRLASVDASYAWHLKMKTVVLVQAIADGYTMPSIHRKCCCYCWLVWEPPDTFIYIFLKSFLVVPLFCHSEVFLLLHSFLYSTYYMCTCGYVSNFFFFFLWFPHVAASVVRGFVMPSSYYVQFALSFLLQSAAAGVVH